MNKIVLASNNKGKVREFGELLAGQHIQVLPQAEFSIPDADETGLTFVENAIIKARHAAQLSGLPAIADDSGLEVDVLDGRPGIYSARYADGQGDAANNAKLLAELKDVPAEKRTARFQCVMVFMRHAADPTPIIAQGTWEGQILTELRGAGGFGYDPLFFVPEKGVTAAELDADSKNALSHRGQALRKLIAALSHLS